MKITPNQVSIPLGTINTSGFLKALTNILVSIPLGTINT